MEMAKEEKAKTAKEKAKAAKASTWKPITRSSVERATSVPPY